MFWNEENHGWNREILHKTIYVHLHKRKLLNQPRSFFAGTLLSLLLQSFTKYSRKTLAFMWNCALRENFNLFLKRSSLVLKKFPFREEEWALGNNSMKFWDFPDISLFPNILSFFLSWTLRPAQQGKCREQVV